MNCPILSRNMERALPTRLLRATALAAIRAVVESCPLRTRVVFRLPKRKGVALTFDDGPDPDHTPQTLRILAEFGMRATFFCVGRRVEAYPDLTGLIVAAGHAIGDHSYSHADCSRLSREAMHDELERTRAAVCRACPGASPMLFRPPWGRLTIGQLFGLARSGRRVVFWSRSLDHTLGPDAIAERGTAVVDRDIVLMHDRNPDTKAALPTILASLRRRDLPTVRLDRVWDEDSCE